jgi:hypothetical protein
MHITCTSFVHHFSKSTIGTVGLTCGSLWALQIQGLILKNDVQKMYNWCARIISLYIIHRDNSNIKTIQQCYPQALKEKC